MTNIPPPILEAIRDNRLILWIGAGFSQRRLRLPAWRGLVDELLDTCLTPDAASEIKTQLDNKQRTEVQALESLRAHAEKCFPVLYDRFHLSLERSDERLQDFHLLWNISPKIVTTNYDTGLDLTRPGSVPKVVYDKKYQLKKLVDGQKFYFKLHGCASEPENCILFEQQYQDLYRDTSIAKLDALSDEDTPAKFLLKNLLTDHVVLFVGFGIEDRVDFVLEYIHRLLGNTTKAKYTLTHRDNTDSWPHTEKWAVDSWGQIPEILHLLAEEKAKHIVPVVRGDKIMPFDRAYVGRDAEVRAVEDFFRENANFFFLSGAGGMGKSHLLDTVLRRLPAEQQPVYFRIERHYTVLTITQKLGIEPVPPTPKNQANQYLLKALERVGKPFVFDDFYEISDPKLYYTLLELPKQTTIKSLIISRSLDRNWARFDSGVHHRELRELERPDFDSCMRAMAEKMPIYASEPPTQQQLDTCWNLGGGYPLGGLLLLGLLAEPDFDPGHIEKLDLASDPSRSHFVGRLLDAILKKGSDAERNLAREIAVFSEPVPEAAFATLPSWNPDRIAFFALWHRKGLLFRRQSDHYFGMHALVRSLILKQLGDLPEARACAGRYYESLTGLSEVEQVVALQKSWEHYNLSPDATRDDFYQRMEETFVVSNVKQLRDEQNPALAIERFLFRQQLNPEDTSAANELGMAYRRQGNFDQAIAVLQKAADMGNIQSYNELGITLREAGQRDKAIAVLQKAADLGHVYSMNELGITLREAGQRDKAIEVLQKAVVIQPDNVILLNVLGITFREAGQRDKAIEVLQKAADLGHVYSMNELGITLREAGQRDKAIEVLRKTADLGHVYSMNELGITLREAGQRDKAIEVLQKTADMGHVYSMNELGITLREAGQRDKAIEVLQKAADMGNIQSYNELGITLREAGQRDKAIEVLQKAADMGNVYSMNELGITLREAGRRDQAIEVLQKAADMGNVYSMNELGITLREAGQRDKAIEVLQKAVDMGNIQSYNVLGITLREAGQRDKAIEVLQKAVDLGNIQSYNMLGITLREAGQRDKAIEVLQKAADMGHVHAMNELGITLREAGQRDKAIEVLQKAADMGNIQSYNELGIALREAGELDKAIEVLQKNADRGNIYSMNELGITLSQTGQTNEAIDVLRKALEKNSDNHVFKLSLLKIFLCFQPNKEQVNNLLTELEPRLKKKTQKYYAQMGEQLEALLKYEAPELITYRQYIKQLFRFHSWHFAVEYITGLIKKHPHAEFKARLGEALCQPVIGRYSEGIALYREVLEYLEQNPKLRTYYQETALLFLEALRAKGGAKEFNKHYARLEPVLRGYPPFEARKASW